jgi:hypothetical protein
LSLEQGKLFRRVAVKLSLEASELQPGNGRGNLSSRLVLAGTIAAVVIGLATYFLPQPKEGTVEYHKRKYAETGVPAWVLKKGVPGFVRDFYERRSWRDSVFHRTALVNLGYLKESVFVFSNVSISNVVRIEWPIEMDGFTSISYGMPSNGITVVARPELTDKIGDAIRKADVPENK